MLRCSFYRGLGPILLKQVPYTLTQLTAFSLLVDVAYHQVLPGTFQKQKEDLSSAQQLAVSIGCGATAGVISSIFSHPGDTILSRINMGRKQAMQTGGGGGDKAKAAIPTVRSVLADIGFRGLWKSVGTRCVMTGVLSAGMFLIYDSSRLLLGLPTASGMNK